MPAAAAPPPGSTGGPSPPDPAELGFPPFGDPAPTPLLPGTQGALLKSSEEDHTPDLKRSEATPDSEQDELESMPPAAAAPPPRRTGGPSPTDPAELGIPPFSDLAPLPPPLLLGTEAGTLLKSSEEDQTPDLKRSEAAPHSEQGELESMPPAAAAPPPRRTGGPSRTDSAELGIPPFSVLAPLPPPLLLGTEAGTLLKSSEEDQTPDLKRSEAAPDSEQDEPESLPPAAATPPPWRIGCPSPADPAEPGFPPFSGPAPLPPPLLLGTEAGTPSKPLEEDQTPDLKRSEAAPGSKDVRTPESSDFFLRKPESSYKKITLVHEAFTDQQRVQLHAQIIISGYLTDRRAPKENNMILAFGHPVESQRYAWEDVWRAALERCQNQMSPIAGLETPPSISLIGTCTVEQVGENTTVGKSTTSEPGQDLLHDDGGERETQGLDVERHTNILEQKNGDEDHLAASCTQKAVRTAEQDSKVTAVGRTIISEPCSREIFSMSLQNDGAEKVCPCDGSARIEPAKDLPSHELNVPSAGILPSVRYDKAIQVLSDDVSGLKKNTVSGGQSVLDSCLKCGKSGQLLKCCSCPLAAHDSCFGSSGRFNDGQFYCPVCFYSKAAEAYKKAEETLSEARKNLSGFFGWKRFAKQQDEQSSRNQQRAANCEDLLNGRCTSERQGNHQSEAASLSRKDEEPTHEKINAKGNAFPVEVVTEKTVTFAPISGNSKAHEKVGNISSSHEAPHGFSPVSCRNTSRRKVSFQEKRLSDIYRKSSGQHDQYVQSPARKRYYPYPPECCYTPASSPIAPRRKSFVSAARRTRLLWTREEEVALKEAVARFAPKDKGNISWVQIREHGKDVFHHTRLPSDLRQKWNYMKRRVEAHEVASFAGLDPRARRASVAPTWMRGEARKNCGAREEGVLA